jgi:serine/threonine protein kinase
VYSFGILLWEMLTGKKPFRGLGRLEFYCEVVGGGYRPNIPKSFPAVLSNLLRDCWREELVARPSFESILATLNTMLVESDPNASSISSSSEISPKKSPGGWSMCNIQRVKPGGMPSAESSPRKIFDLPALVDP